MAHEFSKRLLERANTFELRQKAIRVAVELGMPLREIEEYLDWLDNQLRQEPDRTDLKPIPRPHTRQREPKKRK